MKNNIIKKLISIILATTSVASMSIFSPASATIAQFSQLDFRDKISQFLLNGADKEHKLYYNSNADEKKKSILSILEERIKILDDLQQKSELNVVTNSKELNELKSKINLTVSKKQKDLNKDEIYLADKNIHALICQLDTIANHKEEMLLAVRYPNKSLSKMTIVDRRSVYNLARKIILRAINDTSKSVNDLGLDMSEYRVTFDEYNNIMEKQYDLAITDSDLKTKGDTITDLNTEITDEQGNKITNFAGQAAYISQLNIPGYKIRHVYVGDEMSNNNKAMPAGHTKYTREAMRLIAEKRNEKLLKFGLELVNFYRDCSGYDSLAYIKDNSEKLLGTLNGMTEQEKAKQVNYISLYEDSAAPKGIVPVNWNWNNYKTAIKDVISDSNNCKYTLIKTPADTPGIKSKLGFFHGSSQNIPMTVIVDLDRNSLITAFPQSEEEFKFTMLENKEHAEFDPTLFQQLRKLK